jgi:DNA-binding response OmpR family regulator
MLSDTRMLVVDDEPATRKCLMSYFQNEGYQVHEAETAKQAEDILSKELIDLVLLDIRMPGKDGLTLTRELRVISDVGIILVTGRQDEVDRLIGLECGADDYVTKPFNPREILARAKNLVRRVRQVQSSHLEGEVKYRYKKFYGWTLNVDLRCLTRYDNEKVQLTDGECQLLLALIGNPGVAQSRDALMDKVRSREWVPSDRTIDVLIGRLRRKLRDDSSDPSCIITVHGTGYLFNPQVIER